MTKTRQARFKQRFRPVRYPYPRKALLTRPGVAAYNQDYRGQLYPRVADHPAGAFCTHRHPHPALIVDVRKHLLFPRRPRRPHTFSLSVQYD